MNDASRWSFTASSATAFAPFSQNSAVCRCSGSGSGQAQPWQSKPSVWLSLSSDRADLAGPMALTARCNEIATASGPAADLRGCPTSTCPSSISRSIRRFRACRRMQVRYPTDRPGTPG